MRFLSKNPILILLTIINVNKDKIINNHTSINLAEESDLCFRFEPFILALEAKNIFSANKCISAARKAGYKNAFLNLKTDKQNEIEKIIISIRGSDKIEVMLHKHNYTGENGESVALSEQFLKMLTVDANEKMKRNLEKMAKFETEFENALNWLMEFLVNFIKSLNFSYFVEFWIDLMFWKY